TNNKDVPLTTPAAVQMILDFAPDIVIDLCTAEGVEQILEPVEDMLRAAGGRGPRWVFGDGGQVPQLWAYVADKNDLRQRITGTVPGSLGSLFTAFQSKYDSKAYNDGTSPAALGPAGSYDGVYLLAYSAASLGSLPLTGPNLVSGFSRLVPGPNAPMKIA